MDIKKITYTISFSQRPEDWNIPGAVRLLNAVRQKTIDLKKKELEDSSLKETKLLIERVRRMQ